nr:hypothetical protein GCM10020063_019330 [Dactylosporangium thailandense]
MNPLQELRDVDAPGTTVTVDGLVRAGRARVRRRRTAIAGTAAAAVLAVTVGAAAIAGGRPPAPVPVHPGETSTASPAAPPECEAAWLPGDGPAAAPVIDPTGRWAAALRTGTQKVAIWHDGALVAVREDVAVTRVVGISAKGDVAVNAHPPGGKERAMTINTEYSVILTMPPGATAGAFTEATAINADGDVVGKVGGVGPGVTGAVLWRKRDPGRPVLLAAPAGHLPVALAIGPDGTVGGYVDDRVINRSPYLWRADGTPVPLRLTGGDTNGSVDAIAGDRAVDFGNHLGWRPGDAADPAPQRFATGPGQGRALAADGTVAGSTPDSAYLVRSGVAHPLPLPGDSTSLELGGISADGRTATGAIGSRPLRWICGG